MSLTLVIGNKNYSSWSMRPWIAMKAAGIPFEEVVIPLYLEGSREQILKYSPAGKVPILIDGDLAVWDTIAILEYLAERFPDAGLWPRDQRARSLARSVSAEMHSGFQPLRQHCTMNLWLPPKPRPQPGDVLENMRRIETIWRDCRSRYGQGGPFLFGGFGAADAMYAPVVMRFRTYGVGLGAEAAAYCEAMRGARGVDAWIREALAETEFVPEDELYAK